MVYRFKLFQIRMYKRKLNFNVYIDVIEKDKDM